MKKITKRALIKFMAVVLFGIVLIGASFLPTLWLKTSNMSVLKGYWVTVYYEAEEAAAQDVFNLAEEKAKQLSEKLGFSELQTLNIYIYDHQTTFQTKKYGMIAPLLGLDWYVGDNIKTNVLLTSPARPGKIHNYNNNKEAATHEMVHAYNSILNPKMPLWLNEGIALYLTNGNPPDNLYNYYNGAIPTFMQIQTNNPIKFSNMGGYDFAYTYIEYLDVTYGWTSVLHLLSTLDYQETFGKSAEEIYAEWFEFLKLHNQVYKKRG